ncbi:MAG: hypothetical protein JO128_05745, partial [Alphaproteobacteria bacterium]|nr:hypothetical protein [Alphaproteobacteria bacterium]
MNGVVSMSPQVFTGEACQVRQTLGSLVPLPLVRGEIQDQRHVLQLIGLLNRHLQQQIDLLAAHPIGTQRLERAPRPGAAARDLAALERKNDFRRARIAGDQLELDAERVLEHRGVDVGVRARALAADRERRR